MRLPKIHGVIRRRLLVNFRVPQPTCMSEKTLSASGGIEEATVGDPATAAR